MPKKLQGCNKLESEASASEADTNANVGPAVEANTTADDQHAVPRAIASLKQDLMAKLEAKAIAQAAELRCQVTQIRT